MYDADGSGELSNVEFIMFLEAAGGAQDGGGQVDVGSQYRAFKLQPRYPSFYINRLVCYGSS
jgi:hypothetical protein